MARGRHIPTRSCAACGLRLAKGDLIRIVRTGAGRVEVDPTGKVSGRGTYLCANEECWTGALKRNRLERTLRATLVSEDTQALARYYQENLSTSRLGEGT